MSFLFYPTISWMQGPVKLAAWSFQYKLRSYSFTLNRWKLAACSLALRRFCPPDERQVDQDSRIPSVQVHTHLTPDLLVVGNEANRYIRRSTDQGSRAQVCVGEDLPCSYNDVLQSQTCSLATYAIEFFLSLQAPLTSDPTVANMTFTLDQSSNLAKHTEAGVLYFNNPGNRPAGYTCQVLDPRSHYQLANCIVHK